MTTDTPRQTARPRYLTPLTLVPIALVAAAVAISVMQPWGATVLAGAAFVAALLVRARTVRLPQLDAGAPLTVEFTAAEREQITALPGLTGDDVE